LLSNSVEILIFKTPTAPTIAFDSGLPP